MVSMGNERDVDVPFIGDSKLDDAVVVQIDTGDRTKRLRVYVNEGVVFDRDPESGPPQSEEESFIVAGYRRLEVLEATAIQLGIDLGEARAEFGTRARQLGIKL